ncbi:hypothetical protein [Klebsiella michiganensis]
MKMTKDSLLKIIGAADEVISALADTNDEVHKEDTDKMVRLWDGLNDKYAPPEVVRELARMELAAMDSEPVYQYRLRNGYNGQVTEWQIIRRDQVDFVIKAQPLNAEFRIIAAPQPAPVVLGDFDRAWEQMKDDRFESNRMWAEKFWNACRAAMLAAAPQGVK